MPERSTDSGDGVPMSGQFQTTEWGLVMAASGEPSETAKEALQKLCSIYWYPIYAFVRRQGQTVENAQDLTQEFFLRIFQENYFQVADPQRGRLRSFLLASLKNFLINEWEKARTAKRGGAHATLSWDQQNAEGRYLAEPADVLTPEVIYEKRWAVTLLEQAFTPSTRGSESKRSSTLSSLTFGVKLGQAAMQNWPGLWV
jgi:RNA polymerase sigma-70 factor (ECF subfamily)